MKLEIPDRTLPIDGWNWTLIDRLIMSAKFEEVSVLQQPVPRSRFQQSARFCLIRVNGSLLALDTWDTPQPTCEYLSDGEFHDGVYRDVRLIVKIQCRNDALWTRIRSDCPCPIVPWVMFPSAAFPLGAFRWRRGPHRYLASAHGHPRPRQRRHWLRLLSTRPDIQAGRVPMRQYLDYLADCRWGLVLVGKTAGGDGKNRREPEFLSCGMPLALNYTPQYPFPFEPGIHYFHLDKPTDIARLAEVDPAPFAAESEKLWNSVYRPEGMTDLLLRLIREHV